MEVANILENNLANTLSNGKNQNSFLNSTLGKVINSGLDIGIRAILPNLIEDQVINIKNEILNNGFSEGIKKAISSAIDLGKSAIGIVTGKFENIEQARTAVKAGGLIDVISELLDKGINLATKNKKISNNIGSMLKKGKNIILNNISNNIESSFDTQLNSIEKLEKYSTSWKNAYQNKNFNQMDLQYNKIEKEINNIMSIEKIISDVRKIENLHILIENKGGDFNLSKEELSLASELIA